MGRFIYRFIYLAIYQPREVARAAHHQGAFIVIRRRLIRPIVVGQRLIMIGRRLIRQRWIVIGRRLIKTYTRGRAIHMLSVNRAARAAHHQGAFIVIGRRLNGPMKTKPRLIVIGRRLIRTYARGHAIHMVHQGWCVSDFAILAST